MAKTEGKKKGKGEKKGEKLVHTYHDEGVLGLSDAEVAAYKPRLKVKYSTEVVPALMKEFGFKNPMQVPRLTKITLNMGLGEATTNPNVIKTAVEQLTAMTGQRAVVTRAKKSISNFKLRQGQAIGVMVTLRADRMWEFADRLFNIAIPRVRDFKGTSAKAFDGRSNYSLGLREQTIFPEINYDQIDKVRGLNITFTTTAEDDVASRALLRSLGMPIRS